VLLVSIRDAVNELRSFVAALQAREDIEVTHAEFGGPASAEQLASLAEARVPRELVELFAIVNGIHVEWRFREPDGEGCMRIPPAGDWSTFVGDDESYMDFGDHREALLLDEVTAEGSTWLVRRQGSAAEAPFEIIFASAGEGDEGVVAAGSIAEYLRLAMASGFVPYWPRCFRPHRYVSYAAQERIVTRFRGPALAPTPIRRGDRVHVSYFAEGGRGHVRVALHEAPPSRLTQFCGTALAQVMLDEGTLAWLPHRWLKVVTKPDVYERLRDPSFDFVSAARSDELELFDTIVRAIGPLSHYSPPGPSNARLAAGMLGTRSLASATASVLAIATAAARTKLVLSTRRELVAKGDELDPDELARHRWTYAPEGVLIGLFGGLTLLARRESERRQVPGRELLDPMIVEALRTTTHTSSLLEACTSEAPLVGMKWGSEHEQNAATLDLPADAIVLLGTGS
jgi:hypothetical protein